MILLRTAAATLAIWVALAVLTAGCSSDDAAFPSLAPRPIEKLTTAEPAAPPVTAAAADPALAPRYAAIVADARAGDAMFRKALAVASTAADRAKRAAVGSDAWIDAQQSLTRLVALRAPVGTALAALDGERTSGVFDEAPLDAATSQVQAIDANERDAVGKLSSALPSR